MTWHVDLWHGGDEGGFQPWFCFPTHGITLFYDLLEGIYHSSWLITCVRRLTHFSRAHTSMGLIGYHYDHHYGLTPHS